MVLKLYKNSFSDKMHWSLDFYKADLKVLEMEKTENKGPKSTWFTAQELIKQVIQV